MTTVTAQPEQLEGESGSEVGTIAAREISDGTEGQSCKYGSALPTDFV